MRTSPCNGAASTELINHPNGRANLKLLRLRASTSVLPVIRPPAHLSKLLHGLTGTGNYSYVALVLSVSLASSEVILDIHTHLFSPQQFGKEVVTATGIGPFIHFPMFRFLRDGERDVPLELTNL